MGHGNAKLATFSASTAILQQCISLILTDSQYTRLLSSHGIIFTPLLLLFINFTTLFAIRILEDKKSKRDTKRKREKKEMRNKERGARNEREGMKRR